MTLGKTILAGLALFAAIGAEAADTKLLALDGSAVFVGEIVDADEKAYVIETGLGQMVLPTDTVICQGADCPEIDLPEMLLS